MDTAVGLVHCFFRVMTIVMTGNFGNEKYLLSSFLKPSSIFCSYVSLLLLLVVVVVVVLMV